MAGTVLGVVRAAGRDDPGGSEAPANPMPEEGAFGTVAVIVAARNEAHCIGDCVRAVLGQSYRDFRLIVVNDRSDDGTSDAARTAAGGDRRLHLVEPDLPAIPPGKKRALMAGITATNADLLVFTDADCAPGPGWLRGLVASFGPSTAVVAGYAPLRPRNGVVAGLAALETAANAVTASALVGLGRPTLCTGRNLAYTRSAYEAAGGLEPIAHIPSGDDTLLLQRIAGSGSGRVRYQFHASTHVPSGAPEGVMGWLRQKRRHLSTVRYYSTGALAATLAVRSMDALVVLGVPLALVGVLGAGPFWALLVKVAADGVGLWVGLGRLGERRLLRWLPLLELIHSPLLLLSAAAGLSGRLSWRSK